MKPARAFFVFLVIGIPLSFLTARAAIDPSGFKPAPTRPPSGALIVVESTASVEACPVGKMCVEGLLYNSGTKKAENVKLRVEIGGTKYSAPRTSVVFPCENSVMGPGDRQEFNIQIDRLITYQEKDSEKTIEVGKYNFKVVPSWSSPRKPAPTKKPVKKSNPPKKP